MKVDVHSVDGDEAGEGLFGPDVAEACAGINADAVALPRGVGGAVDEGRGVVGEGGVGRAVDGEDDFGIGDVGIYREAVEDGARHLHHDGLLGAGHAVEHHGGGGASAAQVDVLRAGGQCADEQEEGEETGKELHEVRT